MLLGDTTKFLGVALGMFLSTFLITHMLGMFNGMMRRTYAQVSDIPLADVWVMHPSVEYVDGPAGMPPPRSTVSGASKASHGPLRSCT